MKDQISIRYIPYCLILFLIVVSTERLSAEAFELVHNPEMDKVLEQIFGDFDYATASREDCQAPYDKINEAIAHGSFGESTAYLAIAYIHQGMLGSCLMQNLSDAEALNQFGPVLHSYETALQLAPDWSVPYAMLGNFYRGKGNYTQSPDDFRKAEQFMVAALQIDSQNADYEGMLEEIRSSVTANQAEDSPHTDDLDGFTPIPFD